MNNRSTALFYCLTGVVCLVLTVVLFYDVLNNDTVIYGRDTVSHDYLMFSFGWEKIKSQGIIPLWLPYLLLGIPFIGSFAFNPFYPLSPLTFILPLPLAFNCQYPIVIFLSGMFSFYCFRSWHFRLLPSLFGSLAFMASGHLVSLTFAGHLQKLQAIIWFPFVLGSVKRAIDEKQNIYFLLAGLGLGMQLLAGHLQVFFYSYQVIIFFLLWQILKNIKNPNHWNFALKYSGGFLIITTFALIIAGGQLLPGLEMSTQSNRGQRLSYNEATMGSFPPQELPEFILPRFTGDSTYKGWGAYFGWWGERLVSDYIGMPVFLLAVVGIFFTRKNDKGFFIILLIGSLLLAPGKYSPVYNLFYHYIPGYGRFRSPASIMFLSTFSTVFLAVLGLEKIFKNRSTQNQVRPGLKDLIILYCGSIILLILIWWLYRHVISFPWASELNVSEKLTPKVSSILQETMLRSVYFLSFSFLLLCPVVIGYTRNSLSRSQVMYVIPGLLIMITTIDLGSNGRIFISAMPKKPYFNYLFNDWVDNYLVEKSQPVRFIQKDGELKSRMMMRQLSSIHGYHPVAFKKYFDLISRFGFYHPVLGKLFYLRYVKSTIEDKNLANYYRPALQRGSEILFRRTEELHYIYMPRRLIPTLDERETLRLMLTDEFDPYKISYTSANIFSGKAAINQNEELQYHVTDYGANQINIRLDTSKGGFCVISELATPGWQAWLDGKQRSPLYSANYFFKLVKIPPGTHRLTLIYAPYAYRAGIYFQGLGLSIFLACLVFCLSSARRKI